MGIIKKKSQFIWHVSPPFWAEYKFKSLMGPLKCCRMLKGQVSELTFGIEATSLELPHVFLETKVMCELFLHWETGCKDAVDMWQGLSNWHPVPFSSTNSSSRGFNPAFYQPRVTTVCVYSYLSTPAHTRPCVRVVSNLTTLSLTVHPFRATTCAVLMHSEAT